MPVLSKQVISNYLRSDCQRRLRVDLFPDTQHQLPNGQTAAQERLALGLPPRHVARPGLQALSAAGQEWEEAKLNDLVQTLGLPALVGTPRRTPAGTCQFDETPMASLIARAAPGVFLVQGQFDVGLAFEQALGIQHLRASLNMAYRQLRPDLVQVFGPAPTAARQEVQPDGALVDVATGDQRLALRVIDIKLTAEPSVPYFIEVTFYSMALAGWLADNNLQGQFYVLPEPTVWPGSHDASAIVRLQSERQQQGTAASTADLLSALEEDLEQGEFGVFAPRLRRFLQQELPAIIAAPWGQLPWHVDNRCIGCEYLGYPWPGSTPDPGHCWPMATAQDHLSRVAFVSRGARGALEDHQIASVTALAGTQPTDVAYDSHHVLRATRTVVSGRAQALTTGQASVPPQVGTSAVMPAWADLRIYITADFDLGSGITMAFGFQAVWAISQARAGAGQHYRRFGPQVFPVDQRSLQVEERELGNVLNAIDQAMQWAQAQDPSATVQVYVWDTVTYEHFVRIIGRHLASFMQNRTLRRLAWLFPPDALVANPDLSDRMSPVTVVRDVIRAVVAAPVPHYYSLLNIAREYHSPHTQAPYNLFQVPSLFEDPLSDQIPSERAHEIWSRAGGTRPWNQQLQQLERTVRVRVSAVESVAQRLGDDLQGQLNRTAPRIGDLRPPALPRRMADDARLWFVFTKLNVALEELEIQKVHAMPPHEREARFKSARLVTRFSAAQAAPILMQLGLPADPHRQVYELAMRSTEVRAKEGDFSFALAPVTRAGFLGEKLRRVAGQNLLLPLQGNQSEWTSMQWVTQVTVRAIDRDHCRIVVDFDRNWWPIVQALEAAQVLDLTQDVMMDPVHRDFLVPRVEATLNAIGNPPVAIANALPAVVRATGQARRPTRGQPSPAGELYWNATQLHQALVQRNLGPVRQLLQQNGFDLNQSQWQAWEEALTHRLRLIWGPPGTGKSRTLRTIVLGALHEAAQRGRSLRVLVTGPTYEAIDNVLLEVQATLSGTGALALPSVEVARLRSSTRPLDPRVPQGIDVTASSSNARFGQLQGRLLQNRGLTLVAATSHQAHKLLDAVGGPATPLFDLIVLDEASQVDVASSTLQLAGVVDDGAVVIAGDPKQLPPIHKAAPPLELDHIVGPVFTYFQDRFGIQACVLATNYRSCQAIVDLAHVAEYPRALHAHSPNLRLGYTSPVPAPAAAINNWPPGLLWTPEWASLLDADQRAVCFVYREGRSSQWNQFEADAIAALTWLLFGRMESQLQNERSSAGIVLPPSGRAYSAQEFWEHGVGIVTPHRAQQALTVSRLQSIFQAQGTQGIREAVDTVERFQGQQRDVMLATFALGDPDAISDEDEFLLSLNRFNVMASRARAKLVVFVSQEVVDHLSSDMDVLRGSALLKTFAETFCSQGRPMQLGYLRNGVAQTVDGTFRWRP